MNVEQRNILQRYRRRLADDIILTEEFLADLSEKGIFEWGMINVIKAEKTQSEQIYKLLELLPKRGPCAFDNFIQVLEKDYPWLATQLQTCTKHHEQRNSSKEDDHPDVVSVTRVKDVESLPNTYDEDIRKLVAMFIHRQFGHSRKMSEKDKKAIDKFMTSQLQMERIRYQLMLSSKDVTMVSTSSKSSGDSDVFLKNDIQQHLFDIHMRIERHLSMKEEYCELAINQMIRDEIDFEIIHKGIDKLIEEIRVLEEQIVKSKKYFKPEVSNTPLPDLIAKLHELLFMQQKDLAERKEQINKLTNEVNNYSIYIDKLEKDREKQRCHTNELEQEIAKLKAENQILEGSKMLSGEKLEVLPQATPRQGKGDGSTQVLVVKRAMRGSQVKQGGNYNKRFSPSKCVTKKKGFLSTSTTKS